MRTLDVYYNETKAGVLAEINPGVGYILKYEPEYISSGLPPVSASKQVSDRTLMRMLPDAVSNGSIEVVGRGPATRYKLTPQAHVMMERIGIDLSWKSSQIEGNTYSLLETERLLKEKQTAKDQERGRNAAKP